MVVLRKLRARRQGERGQRRFGDVWTDSEFIHLAEHDGNFTLSFDGASEIRLLVDAPVASVRFNDLPAVWSYEDGEVVIRPDAASGFVSLRLIGEADAWQPALEARSAGTAAVSAREEQ